MLIVMPSFCLSLLIIVKQRFIEHDHIINMITFCFLNYAYKIPLPNPQRSTYVQYEY